MTLKQFADDCAALVVDEDQRACTAEFEKQWQNLSQHAGPESRTIIEAIFNLGWATRACWKPNHDIDEAIARAAAQAVQEQTCD